MAPHYHNARRRRARQRPAGTHDRPRFDRRRLGRRSAWRFARPAGACAISGRSRRRAEGPGSVDRGDRAARASGSARRSRAFDFGHISSELARWGRATLAYHRPANRRAGHARHGERDGRRRGLRGPTLGRPRSWCWAPNPDCHWPIAWGWRPHSSPSVGTIVQFDLAAIGRRLSPRSTKPSAAAIKSRSAQKRSRCPMVMSGGLSNQTPS